MPDIEGSRAFDAAIAEIDRQIEELQRARETLLRLGARPGVEPPKGFSPTTGPYEGDPLTAVREQEFAGLSIAKAAAAFLRKIGRHEKTATIIAAIRKGGVEVGGKYPESSVYTTLARRPGFVALGKNYWDLAERRPDLAQEKKAARPKAAKRKRRSAVGKGKQLVRITPPAPAAASA